MERLKRESGSGRNSGEGGAIIEAEGEEGEIYYEPNDKRSMLPLIPSDSLKLIHSLALMPPPYKLSRLYFLMVTL